MKPRERILKAADELFGEMGFDAATTREIAELSGVNKALIHYHFKSKEGLLKRLLDDYYEDLTGTLRQALDEEGDLRMRMVRMVDAYLEFLRAHRNFARIVQREASGGKHLDRIRTHMVPLFTMGTGVVSDAFPSTSTGDLSAENLLVSFYGMVVGYFTYSDILKHLLGEDPMSESRFQERKRHLRRMIDIVLDAVQAQEAVKGSRDDRLRE